MALLWIEGFETFGTSGGVVGLSNKYVVGQLANLVVAAGRLGGYALRVNSATGFVKLAVPGTPSTVIVGVAWRSFGTMGTDNSLFNFIDDFGNNLARVSIMTGGELKVTCPGGNWTTTGLGIVQDVWRYLELKVVVDQTAGSFDLRVDGSSVLSQTGINTDANHHHKAVSLYLANSYVGYGYDDLYLCDVAGSVNNDFLGPCYVEAIYPTADTASADWTPSTGTDHYALVDENGANNDTDYVSANAIGAKDLYDFGSPATITGSIKGIQVNTDLRATDANNTNLYQVVKSDDTESDGSTVAVNGTSFGTKARVLEVNPDTSVAWTLVAVQAVQCGIKIA